MGLGCGIERGDAYPDGIWTLAESSGKTPNSWGGAKGEAGNCPVNEGPTGFHAGC